MMRRLSARSPSEARSGADGGPERGTKLEPKPWTQEQIRRYREPRIPLPAAVIRNVIAPLWARHERSPYLDIARALQKEERLSGEERRARQWDLLRRIVASAWENSPYYRRRFDEAGFEPGDLKDWNDLLSLPVLTKQDIRENAEEILSRRAEERHLHPRKTSGSTGVSLNFFVDAREFQYKRGVTMYRDQWTGWRIGEWRAFVWGNPVHLYTFQSRLRNLLLERCFSLDTLRMDEDMMESFARKVLRLRPTMLFGHAHSLYLFAKFWEERRLPPYRFRGILSTAMVLHDHERRKCEEVFSSRVFDRYGCEEVSLIASECEAHQGLHVNTDSLVVEVLKDDRVPGGGEEGAVVVTDLRNTAMPFIRYRVGDMAVASDRSCPCGRTYPLLRSIAGRIADYLRTPRGEWVSGISLTENFATLIRGLAQVQIVQDRKDHLILRVVPGPDFGDQSREEIRKMVAERFGAEMGFTVETIDRILPEPSGKYRFSICKLDA